MKQQHRQVRVYVGESKKAEGATSVGTTSEGKKGGQGEVKLEGGVGERAAGGAGPGGPWAPI